MFKVFFVGNIMRVLSYGTVEDVSQMSDIKSLISVLELITLIDALI